MRQSLHGNATTTEAVCRALQNSQASLRADPRSWDSGAMSWFGQASEHDADHGETDESGGGSCIALEVARQTAVSTDPGEGAFDDPALGKNDEAMQLVSLDDFQRPGAGLCDGCGRFGSLVAGVGEDALDEGKEAVRTLVKNQSRAVAILHIGRVDDDVQQEAERVDENVALAARDLLARIEALRVERRAPF